MNLGIALSENNNKKRTTYNEQPANYSEAETFVIFMSTEHLYKSMKIITYSG